MNFKNVLVYLDGSDRSEVIMQMAASFAKRHEARLSGLHVVGFPLPTQTGTDSIDAFGKLCPPRSLAMIREFALATADRAETIFREQLNRTGLSGDWHAPEGMVAYTAGIHARDFDLTIAGQIDPAHPPLGTRRLVPEALLLESGRPVLILPCIGQFDTIGENVLIGWNRSREAARAMNDALPILEKARSVAVLTCVSGQPEPRNDEPDPASIVSHLACHGVAATASIQEIGTATVAVALLDHAARNPTDLLVMGGYGRSRLREVILGGTTRAILREMTLPVFIAH
ncbi:MAG TPA: universal stress protein [Rhodopila sp.]